MSISALRRASSAMTTIIKRVDTIAENIAKIGMGRLYETFPLNNFSLSMDDMPQLTEQNSTTINGKISIISELIQLIIAKRSFQANTKIVKVSDKLLENTVKIV